ncbi:MAG TPA: ATP synthase subunit C [Clostridiales bacterium]|nr:MAG: V-type ATP synthase subunit K [Firmicutes bacterium ADurb.Bin262]HOU09089.1 ATP synthase subunit C [Clostridiales bacterium]HQK72650.1 ATP synthase subunit C [Clostridiales bacterium]
MLWLTVLLVLVVPAALFGSVLYALSRKAHGKPAGRVFKTQLVVFAVIAITVSCLVFTAAAAGSTQTTTAAAAQTQADTTGFKGLGLLAAGIVTGLAGIGGGIAVAAGAPAAIAASSEDPKSFGKSLIFVALGESIALYGVVISILILNKV